MPLNFFLNQNFDVKLKKKSMKNKIKTNKGKSFVKMAGQVRLPLKTFKSET